jgi:hypothetical protein
LYARRSLNSRPMFSRACLELGFAMRASSAVNCSRSSTPPNTHSSETIRETKAICLTFALHVFSNLVSHSRCETLLFCHFFLHLEPGKLRFLSTGVLWVRELQPTLSSLSTAEDIVRNLADGTPHTSNRPSNSCRWLIYKKIFRIIHSV